MKITKGMLKELIKEELENMTELETIGSTAATTPPTAGDPKGKDPETLEKLGVLRTALIDASKMLGGIQINELPLIQTALLLINKAKGDNINVGQLKTHMALVQADLDKLKG